jgi:hypothetical protein
LGWFENKESLVHHITNCNMKIWKGWKHGQRSQGCQGKSPFPRTADDTCHFYVGL